MTQDEIWVFVRNSHTGIMTTLRRDGMPISTPLWFVCLDQKIYFQARGMKLKRLKNDPRASFLVESGTRWVELKAVHFTGTTEVVEAGEELSQRFQAEVDRKYSAARATGGEMPTASKKQYSKSVGKLTVFTPDDRILNWDNAKMANS